MSSNPLAVLPTLEKDLDRVEAALSAAVTTRLPYLNDLAMHLMSAGGKRVRPGFSIAAAASGLHLPAPAHDDVVLGGVAVELVHLGSLYHDDVMDDATTRRGVESVNAKWGNNEAILTGDFLLGRASTIAARLGTEVSAVLAEAICSLVEGQIRELQAIHDPGRTPDDYDAAISGKTASLLGAACRIGALTGGLDPELTDTLSDFGLSYGMAFQIVDDILDIVATSEQLGKPAGNDVLEGNYSLPVIFALRSDVSEQLGHLLTPGITPDERDQALVLVRTSPGVAEALTVARAWADRASAALDPLDDNPGTDALKAAAAHLISKVSSPLT